MPWTIDEFHTLYRPQPDNTMGLDDNKDWCVHSTSNNLYYLLNNGSFELADLSAGLSHKEFYFDTEEKCHEHAAAYYEKHSEDYPFMIEWIAASGIFAEDESQVMNFI